MADFEPVPFPFQIDDPDSPVFLEAFHTQFASELWDYVRTDRESPARKNVWPDLHSLADTEEHLSLCDISDPDSEAFDYFIRLPNRELVGTFHIHTLSWLNRRTEVGYSCHHKFEGQGLVSAALFIVEDHLKAVGFHRIEIRCEPSNTRSCILAKRNGYVLEGTLTQDNWDGERYRDSAVYGKLLLDLG